MTRTLFRGGQVWDGCGDQATSADVVVEDGVVRDVGPGLDGDNEIDCTGATVVPGFFDCHVHMSLTQVDPVRMLRARPTYRVLEAARNLEMTLRAGVTTVRDAGGTDAGVREAVRDGLIAGPRLKVAVTVLSQTGGHGDNFLPCGIDAPLLGLPGAPCGVVDGVDEMRKGAREIIRAGADVLKVCTSGGGLSPDTNPRHPHFQPDELAALVAEANAVQLPVMAHAQSTQGIKNAVAAGVRSIEHGIYLDEEAVEMMLARGTFLVPTLVAPRGVIVAAELGLPIPEESVRKAREAVAEHEASFRLAVSAGVRVAMGTDSGITPHGSNLAEVVLMHELGMSTAAALRSATSDAAELLGLGDVVGALEPGKSADIVLIEDDPLSDLSDLGRRVKGVWQAGVGV